MSTIINGTSSAITFPDSTVQNTAFTGTAYPTGPAFGAYLSSNQSISSGVTTKISFDTEEFDTNNNFASSRFTPTVAGYYQINAASYIQTTANTQSPVSAIYIYKNGSINKQGGAYYNGTTGGTALGAPVSTLVYCNGTTDYIEVYGITYGTSPVFTGGAFLTYINGYLARAA